MESSEGNTISDSWTPATNWIVAGGSFTNSVTFESSLSLINNDQNDNHDLSSADTSASNSPLILYSPSPNSPPFEITITFPQKHEIQQIYIRSTARIYEIYCAYELGGCNEYLCTVRCGVATRDEQVLHATDIEKVVCAHQKGSIKEDEYRERSGGNLNTNEDDWVEVKMLGTSMVVNGNSSLSLNTQTSEGGMSQKQDFFEATAAITDANPCISITLKLLSLQNKTCVCIDEIYVFADPIDPTELDDKAGPTENASGSSLMSMLIPTFLELSKTKRSQAQDKLDTNRTIEEKPSHPVETKNKVSEAEKTGSTYNEEIQSQEAVIPIRPQVLDTESKQDMPHSHIEDVLNKLVSRVERIEDMFSKFENLMVNPIRSIDERLQRVEQHLEILTKKIPNSGLLSCNRISAPEFSCSESETNSLYNSGCADLGESAPEANKKAPAVPAIPANISPVSSSSVDTISMRPSVAVTAPEFSNGVDVAEYDGTESSGESCEEKQEIPLSIDDALASALARLISSTSGHSPKYSKVLSVKAPEFPEEGDNSNGKTASDETRNKISTEPISSSSKFEERECVISSSSPSSASYSEDTDEIQTRSPEDDKNGETDEYVEICDEPIEKTELDQCFAVSNESVPSTEVKVLDEIAEFRNSAIKVDFEIPILEVKFNSEASVDAKSSLEALLGGMPDFENEDNSVKEKSEDSSRSEDRQFDLIPVEDFGERVSSTGNGISIDAEYCSLTALPLDAKGIMHLI